MRNFIGAVFIAILFNSCGGIFQKPQVRFYNTTNADLFWKYGGCKFGDAEFPTELRSFNLTPYRDTESGEHFVEFMNESGQWIPVSLGKLGDVKSGGEYSIWISTTRDLEVTATGNVSETGNEDAQFFFQLVED